MSKRERERLPVVGFGVARGRETLGLTQKDEEKIKGGREVAKEEREEIRTRCGFRSGGGRLRGRYKREIVKKNAIGEKEKRREERIINFLFFSTCVSSLSFSFSLSLHTCCGYRCAADISNRPRCPKSHTVCGRGPREGLNVEARKDT
jgi:hypothetical protein